MIKKHLKPVFLKWILLISLIGLGSFFAFSSNLIGQINEVDSTKISFIIYGTFLAFSIRTGMLTYKAADGAHTDKSIDRLVRQNESGWFVSDALIAAGMIGTVIGFIYMMTGTFDSVSSANVQHVIIFALGKMGLALYTTASGLICSLVLKMQLFNLSQYLNTFKRVDQNTKTCRMVCDE